MKVIKMLAVIAIALSGMQASAQAVRDSNRLALYDTRSVPTTPGDYAFSLQMNTKYASIVNLPNVGNDFVPLLGIRAGLTDAGGKGHELAFGSNNYIYVRSGYIASGWEGWRRLLSEDANGNVSIGGGMVQAGRKLDVRDTLPTLYVSSSSTLAIPAGDIASLTNFAPVNGSISTFMLTASNSNTALQVSYVGSVSNGGTNAWAPDMVFGRRTGGNSYAESMRIAASGNVGIGTTAPGTYKLAVEGTIGARKVKVTTTSWADFVFDPGYKRRSLEETEAYINAHQHLPDVPSSEEVKKDGQDLGEMNKILLQKVEELTLQLIEMNKQIKVLQAVKSK